MKVAYIKTKTRTRLILYTEYQLVDKRGRELSEWTENIEVIRATAKNKKCALKGML